MSLYDSKDEKVEPERVYSDSDKFKTLSYNDLAKGKTISGYVVFEVDKDQKYELHYSPASYTTEDEVKEVHLNAERGLLIVFLRRGCSILTAAGQCEE